MKEHFKKFLHNAGILFIILAVSFVVISDLLPEKNLKWDFLSFYQASKAARHNDNIYSWEVLESHIDSEDAVIIEHKKDFCHTLPYLYPPFLAYAITPLTEMEFAKASFYWTVILLFVFTFAVYVCYLTAMEIFFISGRKEGKKFFNWFIFGIIAAFTLLLRDNIWLGQVNIIVLFFISLAVFFSMKDKQIPAGIFLGAAIMIKITPFLLLAWLAGKKQYRAAAWTIASCLILTGFSFAQGAFQNWLNFFEYLPTVSYGSFADGFNYNMLQANYSIPGILSKLIGLNSFFVKILSMVFLAGAALYIFFNTKKKNFPFLMLLPALIFMVITSPVAYKHHLIYLMPGTAVLSAYIWFFSKNRRILKEIVLFVIVSAFGSKFFILDRFLSGDLFALYKSSIYLIFLAAAFAYHLYIIGKNKRH